MGSLTGALTGRDDCPRLVARHAQEELGRATRLRPLMSTHLSFRDIGERLSVSQHTVKTQAISIYRKLGVASRSQAVQRAQQLGLGG